MTGPFPASNPPKTSRDPVCESIESLLHALESEGKRTLKVTRDDGSVRISFAGMHAHGVTYDIALVRLASAMMDDARYRGAVMETLRGPMQIDS